MVRRGFSDFDSSYDSLTGNRPPCLKELKVRYSIGRCVFNAQSSVEKVFTSLLYIQGKTLRDNSTAFDNFLIIARQLY